MTQRDLKAKRLKELLDESLTTGLSKSKKKKLKELSAKVASGTSDALVMETTERLYWANRANPADPFNAPALVEELDADFDTGGPFLPVGCAGLSPEHLESELFGHTKGAHEGATSNRPGLFQQGAHGTIYLEDVDQLPLPLQDKLLRALREAKVTRAGSERASLLREEIVQQRLVDGLDKLEGEIARLEALPEGPPSAD